MNGYHTYIRAGLYPFICHPITKYALIIPQPLACKNCRHKHRFIPDTDTEPLLRPVAYSLLPMNPLMTGMTENAKIGRC